LIRSTDDAASSGHRLAENDIIKFGRSQFRVRQLSLNKEAVILDDGSASKICRVDPAEFDELADKPCRVCLQEGSSLEDPLLAPCQCRGSIRHVHLDCLKHWVRDRLGISNGDAPFVVGGNTSSLSCELCKTAYQTRIQMGRDILPLVEIDSPFIVLESCNDHRHHVLPVLPGKSLKVGRGHECDMNIHDTSISRVQATIELDDKGFMLKDGGSRFGTYIKITKPMLLEAGQQVSVQVGRTILQICTKAADNSQAEELCRQEVESCQQHTTPEASLNGDDAHDTDPTQSPRASNGRDCVIGALEHSSPSQEDFLSCEGH